MATPGRAPDRRAQQLQRARGLAGALEQHAEAVQRARHRPARGAAPARRAAAPRRGGPPCGGAGRRGSRRRACADPSRAEHAGAGLALASHRAGSQNGAPMAAPDTPTDALHLPAHAAAAGDPRRARLLAARQHLPGRQGDRDPLGRREPDRSCRAPSRCRWGSPSTATASPWPPATRSCCSPTSRAWPPRIRASPDVYDALFVPRSVHHCGALAVHDMAFTRARAARRQHALLVSLPARPALQLPAGLEAALRLGARARGPLPPERARAGGRHAALRHRARRDRHARRLARAQGARRRAARTCRAAR